MTEPKYFLAPITLLAPSPGNFPSPKFRIGQKVLWKKTSTHGFGKVIELVFEACVLVQSVGYRYAVIVSGKYLSGISIFHTNLPEP